MAYMALGRRVPFRLGSLDISTHGMDYRRAGYMLIIECVVGRNGTCAWGTTAGWKTGLEGGNGSGKWVLL